MIALIQDIYAGRSMHEVILLLRIVGMRLVRIIVKRIFLVLWVSALTNLVFSQNTGAITGSVSNEEGNPVHHAVVLVVQTGQTVETDHDGRFLISGVEPGVYDLFAEAAIFTSQLKLVAVSAGETAEVNMVLVLSPVRDTVTVTARGRHETTFQAVQSVHSLETFDITENLASSIGEVLEGELGIAKRSFGPGSSRPVIRGFDGDRVLILNDGMRTGSLGSASGDHGEPLDPGSLERLEVVKGPATLLYGSNAIGGVVNAISRHHEMHKHRHEGIRGQITSGIGSNNGLASGNASIEYGIGNWMIWGGGGGQRTGDYRSPEGIVENSKTKIANGKFGLGYFGDRFYMSGGYGISDGRYGIPFADEIHGHGHSEEHPHEGEEEEDEDLIDSIDVSWRNHNLRFNTGFQNLESFLESVRLGLSYTKWQHDEIESFVAGGEEIGTSFDNEQLTYRGDFDHSSGRVSGTWGIWGTTRDYEAAGEEALSPPVKQNGIATYVLEEVNFERIRLQFGARLEHMRYKPQGPVERLHDEHEDSVEARQDPHDNETVYLPNRNFTGVSGSAGFRAGLWRDGAFVAHFTSSYRSPSLEELYNYGPHIGNLAFEIGNPDLEGERSTGFDLSIRHGGEKLRLEGNFFYYHINNFIFGAPTGETEHELSVIRYEQGNSRFVGTELGLDVSLLDYLWLNTGLDLVNADLTETDTPLPRIPPLRGKFGLDFRYDRFSFQPELVMSARQDQIFPTETETAGHGVINLKASYTYPQNHFIHHFAFEVFNVGDKLYRNHVSFIKDLAPEMGRGVKFSYAVKFF
jgi:iron complex outermembrane receptor protein